MKFNKNTFNARLSVLVNMPASPIAPCEKMAMDNIVFPRWSELGAFAYMHKYMPMTAEQPDGCAYNHTKFQSVLRVLDGKVLFDDARRVMHGNKRTDNYCWDVEKVNKLVAKGQTRPIGTASAEGLLNLMELSATITNPEDKLVLAETFSFSNKDMLLAHTDAENRFYIRITQALYDAGWTFCVDEWMEEDANGDADTTELFVGDVIIVNRNADGSVTGYRIDREMFETTHKY